MLYLYLASNADGYNLALSPAAIKNAIGMPPSTYRDQIKKLITSGYLVNTSGNSFDFFEVPQTDAVSNSQSIQLEHTPNALNFEEGTDDNTVIIRAVRNISSENREINNTKTLTNTVGINISDLKEAGDIYIPKVKEIRIPVPKAERKKEFIF